MGCVVYRMVVPLYKGVQRGRDAPFKAEIALSPFMALHVRLVLSLGLSKPGLNGAIEGLNATLALR